jgi:hypothetical protein
MKSRLRGYLKTYSSHVLVAVLTLAFFSSVYTALAVNYVTPGLTLDPGADFPVLCVDPLNDCTTQVLRIGNPVGGATSGSIPFVDASGNLAEDNANLFWDETNNILGIGTNTPSATLDLFQPNPTGTTIVYTETNSSVTGLEDATFSGTYTGGTDEFYYACIDSTGATDTFEWGSSLTTVSFVPITGGAQLLDQGISVTFGAITGHTLNDCWFFSVDIQNIEIAPFRITANDGELFAFMDDQLDNNVSFGYAAGTSLTDGSNNIFMGQYAGNLTDSGYDNIFMGQFAGSANTIGTGNIGLGAYALSSISTGSSNIAHGDFALSNNEGSNNVAVGTSAGSTTMSGDENVFIGSGTGTTQITGGTIGITNTTIDESIAIGYRAQAVANNQLVFGSPDAPVLDAYFGSGMQDYSTPADVALNASGGYGTNITGANLILAGGKATGNADSGDIIFQTATTNGVSGTTLRSLTEKARLTNDGFFGIGATAPGVLLHVTSTSDTNVLRLQDSDGTCNHNPESGSETVSCSSDENLKINIRDASSILGSMRDYRIRQYDVIASGDEMIGVIAQETLDTHPDRVHMTDSGFYTVDLPTTWEIVKAIQELDIHIAQVASQALFDTTAIETVIKNFLGNIANGLEKIFAKEVHTELLCVGDFCVTQEQFMEAFNQSESDEGSTDDAPPPEESIDPVLSDEEVPDEDTSEENTDEPVDEVEPEEPVVEDTPPEEPTPLVDPAV